MSKLILIFLFILTILHCKKYQAADCPNVNAGHDQLLPVFNRWSNLMFEQLNFYNKWDEKNLTDDTFYYVFKYLDKVYYVALKILIK